MKNALILLCFAPFYLLSQNLVMNPGFEEWQPGIQWTPCKPTAMSERFNVMLKGWKTFSYSTPDILSYTPEAAACYTPIAQEGATSLGLIMYLPQFDTKQSTDYHEFIQGTLSKPLTPGQNYRVQFWLYQHDSLATHHIRYIYGKFAPPRPVLVNNIGVYFSMHDMSGTSVEKAFQLKPQLYMKDIAAPPAGEWQLFSWDFIPDKPYRYFTIGNFFTDVKTLVNKPEVAAEAEANAYNNGKYVGTHRTIKRIAYYAIDAVYIGRAEEVLPTVTSTKPYTFRNVQFATGKWELLPGAEQELQALANFIKRNPNKRFEISGHTDNTGDAAANKVLSEKRAQTVHDYLLQQNIQPNQLIFKGYGADRPVGDNNTSDGRQQNRRVECIMLPEKD